MRMLPENTLALVVDYQEKLVPAMAEKEEMIEKSVVLLEGLRALDVPLIVSQQYTRGLGETVAEIRAVIGEETKAFDKLAFSLWDDEAIRAEIEKTGRKTVLLCGMESHVCVLQTAIDLIGAGYTVFMVEDCMSSRKEHDMELALRRAEQEGAFVTGCEAVLFELTRKAGTPVFKIISKLVK